MKFSISYFWPQLTLGNWNWKVKSQISKGMIVQLVSDFLLWTWFIILKPMDTNCPCRISKVFGSKFTDLCVLTPSFLYTLLLCSRHVRGHSTLRDPICSSFVCCFSRTLYSLSVPGKHKRAELHAALRTEIMRRGACLDSFQWLPSVTFYLKIIYSVISLLLRIWNAFWLCFCSIFFFYCLKLPCIKIYKLAFLQIKHPSFSRGLGPLHLSSHQLQSPGPGL